MNQKTIKLLKIVTTGMVVVAVLLAFFITGIRILGFQVFGVLTGSMEPTYPVGSLIYVRSVKPSKLEVNDVITFNISPTMIATHRIVEIVSDESNPSGVRFRTKGDANSDVDASLVSAESILGKVMFSIPGMGYLASYIQKPPGLYVAILVCALMVAFVFYTDSLEKKLKKRTAARSRQRIATEQFYQTEQGNHASMNHRDKQSRYTVSKDASQYKHRSMSSQPMQQPARPLYQDQNRRSRQQGYDQPMANSRQPYPRQTASQQHYNAYQQPMQSDIQQPHPKKPQEQQAYQPSRPRQRFYPAQSQQEYPYPQHGCQQPYYPRPANQSEERRHREAANTRDNQPSCSRRN